MAVMFTAFVLLREAGFASVAWSTFSWAGAGCVCRIVGLLQLKVLPCGPITAVRWLRGHSDIAPRLFAEFAITTGVSMVTIFAIGGIAGLGELGRLQAAQIMLGPLNIMFSGVGLVATAEGVRLLRDSPKRLAHDCRWLSLALTMGVLAWGLIIGFVPRSIGEFVLRTGGTPTRPAGAARLPLCTPPLSARRSVFIAWQAARRILRARCIEGVLTLFFGLAGAYLAGAKGGAWGFAVAGALKTVNAWWQFSLALREPKAAAAGAGRGGLMRTICRRRPADRALVYEVS